MEQKTTLRFENRSYLGRWTLREGAELNYSTYHNKTLQRTYQQEAELLDYRTYLGIVGWGFFVGADYASADKRLTVSMGVRADGCDYSAEMRAFLEAAFAPCVGFLCLERQLVGERKRRAFLPVAALYGARL